MHAHTHMHTQNLNMTPIPMWPRVAYAHLQYKQTTGATSHLQSPPKLFVSFSVAVPVGSPSHGGDVTVYALDINQLNLPRPYHLFLCLFLSLWPFQLYSFHKSSWLLSALSFCSSSLMSALLVFSTMYLFMKVSLSPDTILCGWLGLKHYLTHNYICSVPLFFFNY